MASKYDNIQLPKISEEVWPQRNEDIAGKPYTLAEMQPVEVQNFNVDYDRLCMTVREDDWSADFMRILATHKKLVFDTVMAEKNKVNMPYDGRLGSGSGLTLDLFSPMMFGCAAVPKYTWAVGMAAQAWVDLATGTRTWIQQNDIASALGAPFTFDRYAAAVFMGEFVPVGAADIIINIAISKNGVTPTGWTNEGDAKPVIEYPEPIVVLGEETILISHFSGIAGTDYHKPLGIGIFPGNRVRPPTTVSPLRNV